MTPGLPAPNACGRSSPTPRSTCGPHSWTPTPHVSSPVWNAPAAPTCTTLVNAAGFQGSAEWGRALLSTLSPDVGGHLARATQDRRVLQLPALLRPLPLDERCAWVHRALSRTGDLDNAGYLLRVAGGPWTPELSVAATRMLLKPRNDGGYRALCEAAAEYLPPEHLDHLPPDPPGLAPEDHRLYLDTRDTVRFRRDMQREL